MKLSQLAFVAATLLVTHAHAQKMTGIALDKGQNTVGQAVKATVSLDAPEGSANCGLMLNWGDGSTEDIKIFQKDHMPVVRQHTYAKPGNYSVTAEAKKVTSHLGCLGKKLSTSVQIVAPAASPTASAAVSAPASVAAAPTKPASPCPDGWKLDAKSVNKKTGAFTCTAKAGTKLPDKKLECGGDTGYFENAKKAQIGCKP